MDGQPEVELTGGNASGAVVRAGTTVRKPWLASTERVIAFLAALRAKGIDVPEHQGRDEHGRQVLEYVPGQVAMDRGPLGLDLVAAIGHLVRTMHDASTGLPVPDDWPVLLPVDDPDLLCHNDLASWNLVIDGDRLVFIDWDGAGPSTRLWDLAYSAISFAHLFPDSTVAECTARLDAFLAGYRADRSLRQGLPSTLTRRSRAMHDLLRDAHCNGRQPWATMYAEGHGQHWRATTAFIESHETDWAKACDRA